MAKHSSLELPVGYKSVHAVVRRVMEAFAP